MVRYTADISLMDTVSVEPETLLSRTLIDSRKIEQALTVHYERMPIEPYLKSKEFVNLIITDYVAW